ncbi:hypothetical protein [Nocardioides houyundeii]|uniref:hypothetical protein n=1 Tax=Nocardioides houyundeii TaxID=2045452 RepID=UPI000C760D4A|nr:hypothetical protein [Nocardioides houyundeii]
MTVYLAWTSETPEDLDGPWQEARQIAPGLLALESTETLSVVYHALKWALSDEGSLIVVPVDRAPKSRGMAPGTTSWLRERTTPGRRDDPRRER